MACGLGIGLGFIAAAALPFPAALSRLALTLAPPSPTTGSMGLATLRQRAESGRRAVLRGPVLRMPRRPPLPTDRPLQIGDLPLREQKGLYALLEHGAVPRAAAAAGIPERTLRAWSCRPDFRELLVMQRGQLFDSTVSRLAQLSLLAADTLDAIMKDADAPHAARVNAAKCVLELAKGSVIDSAMKQQLNRIESMQQGRLLPGDTTGVAA